MATMRLPLIRSVLLGCCAVLASCTPPAPEMLVGPATPPMWVIHDTDTRIVLLGSVHQLPPGVTWTGGRLATELRLADELVLELSPEESAAAGALFAELGRDEPVPPAASRFGDHVDELIDLIADVGLDEEDADGTESWALALAVGNALSRRSGLASDEGVETVLTATFRAHGLPVTGLETARQQLEIFDRLSPADQQQMVTLALDNRDESLVRARRLLHAWAEPDLPALAAIADEAVAETPFLVEPLIRARNRAWAALLAERLNDRGDLLVAVGVGHLVGDGSLLDELRARGLRPMRLQ